jgi:transposase
MLRTKPNEPMAQWALGLAARRNRQVAVVALARKVLGILWAMWSKGES